MSDEDFFRGLTDDVVDSTSKMMEEAHASSSKAKGQKADKEDATVSQNREKQSTVATSPQRTDEGNAVAKVTMQLVQLELESKPARKVTVTDVVSVVEAEHDYLPPIMSEKTKAKKSKKEGKQKEKKQQNEAKDKESTTLERKLKKMKKKEAKKEKQSSEEYQKQQMKRNHKKLVNLQNVIREIEEQIDTIKGEVKASWQTEASPNCTDTQKSSTSNGVGKKDTTETSEKKAKKMKRVPKDNQSDRNPDTDVEQRLLLQLFAISSLEREKYITKRGTELGLLEPHPFKRNAVVVNERFKQLSESLIAEAKEYVGTNRTATDPPVGEQPKVKRVHKTFEEQINALLNLENGKPCAVENYNPELMLTAVRDEKHVIVQDRLESFVERLVASNVGYMVEGLLRVNVRQNMQSFVNDPTREANVYIHSILLRRCAMDGDLVRVFVKNGPPTTVATADDASGTDGDAQETRASSAADGSEIEERIEETKVSSNNVGFVVKILEKRSNRQCVGMFLPATSGKKHYRMFMPRDMRIPPVRVFKQDWPNALIEAKPQKRSSKEVGDKDATKPPEVMDVTKVLYQAEIIEWQDDVPIGTILKSIGKCGVLEVENESILVEYNLDVTPYGEEILAQLPSVPYRIPQDELAKRTDLRGECIFTIDPATARDLDDALSCKTLPNGNFEVGVHISDVTYFLRERSDLDELVKLRATSIYMVDTVYHMLPKQLCNTCSLLPGEDKLAFSVFWEMLPDGTVLSTRFARSVINSCAQLSYEHAQMMLDNPKCDSLDEDLFPEVLHGHTVRSLGVIVNQLQSIAVKIRQRRMDDGCLKINQPKLTFRLDPATGRPIEYGVYKLRASNEMIEDFMLLANTSVAKAIHETFPEIALLRNHKPPAENMMKNLVKTLASHGHKFSYASSKAIRESMDALVAGTEHPDATCSVLNILLSKPMTRALYYCSAFAGGPDQCRHYALAIPMYTHFTSPIRRYADCLVHRVLAAMLGIDDKPERSSDEVQKLATICNEKKYNAKLAGDASSLLYYRHWLRTMKLHETIGAVLGYGAHFIELVLIHSGIVVKASTKKISAVASVVFKPVEPVASLQLIPNDTTIEPVVLKIFSKVRVTIKLVNDAITVCSILPMVAELSAVQDPTTDADASTAADVEMKSSRVF